LTRGQIVYLKFTCCCWLCRTSESERGVILFF